ncbi:MAG: hypothetical protein RL398_1454 [Planctomycetota bacterium]
MQSPSADLFPVVDAAALDAAAAAKRARARRRNLGISIIVLVVTLGLLASIAVPNWLQARRNHNESAALATLKNISSAQSQCQASGAIDVNGNGAGEYGFFAELAGSVELPGGKGRMAPPVLSKAFAEVVRGQVRRGGYIFAMVLPRSDCRGVREGSDGGRDGAESVDPGQAEALWACYAWPIDRDRSGTRAFFVNQAGDVLATNGRVRAYDGDRLPMPWDAAFALTAEGTMASPVAANTVGKDGNTWVVM